MDSKTNVSLDTSEVRPARKAAAATPPRAADGTRPSRLLIAGGAGLGLAILTGVGFGAYTVLAPAPVSKFAAPTTPRGKIQFGPLADMPEIRDGVPAIARSVPANLIERRVVEAAPAPAAATPQASERDVAAALARRSGPLVSDPSAEAANARAMASTLSTASLRPIAPAAREAAAPVRIVATQPVPSAPGAAPAPVVTQPPVAAPAPVVAALEPAASPVPADAPPAGLRRDPEPVGSIQPAPAPVRPVAAPAQPPRTASTETPPLPPVRRAARASEAPGSVQPNARQPSTAQRPVNAPADTSASVAARAASQAEERPEIFGVPLPRFVPTGRQIRDAASSVADAVTSIPDVF